MNIKNKIKSNFLPATSYQLLATILHTTCYLLLTTILLATKPVFAQTIGLSISPPLLEVMIKPGKTITQAYDLTNKSDRDLYLVAKIVPFAPSDQFGHISLNLESQIMNQESFFSLQNSNLRFNQPFKLSAGSKQQLVIKISIPRNNQEKDYYYTLLVEQTDQGEFIPNVSGGSHRIKIGANILMTVSETGQPKTDFEISRFTAEPKFADLFDTVKFKLVVENTGQAYFKPNGKIEIYNALFNKKVSELELLPENILVDSTREIRCQKKELKNNEEQVTPIPCQFSSWLPGKYKATVGTEEDSLKTTTFYLIPYRLLSSLVVIGLIFWQIKTKLDLDNK